MKKKVKMSKPRIPVEECKHRKLYRFSARNFDLGVFDEGRKGFIGLREKFGNESPFMEFHWDAGPPFGTVSPYEEIDEFLPEDIKLTESEPTVCKNCGVRAKWKKTDPDSYIGVWYHLAETDCDNVYPIYYSNRALQKWLEQMIVKHKSEFPYIFTGELDKHYYMGTDEEDNNEEDT